jgi:hypothetical protein
MREPSELIRKHQARPVHNQTEIDRFVADFKGGHSRYGIIRRRAISRYRGLYRATRLAGSSENRNVDP